MSTPRRTAAEVIRDGKARAVQMLRLLLHELPVDISTVVPILVHRTTKSAELRSRTRRADGDWSLAMGSRQDALQPLVDQGVDVATLADRVAVVVCAGNKHLLTFIDPVDLLPASDFGDLTENVDGSYDLTLRQTLLAAYFEDEGEGTSDELRGIILRFRQAVRGAMAAELAKAGPKRSLIEIAFEVAGGPALEARSRAGERITADDILRGLDRRMN